MSQNSCIPNNGEVAILMHSESESEEDLVHTNVNHDMPSIVYVCKLPGYLDVPDETTCVGEYEVQRPVNGPLHPDHVEIEPSHGDTVQQFQSAATISPQNKEDADKDEYVRTHVLETCTQLLVKLETVRLSVLHLQYSLHAGGLAASQIESVDRSSRLWAWDQPSQSGEISSAGIPDPPKLSGDDFPIEILDSFNLTDDILSGLDVFGVPELIDEPNQHFDCNIDNVSTTSELLCSATTEGCF